MKERQAVIDSSFTWDGDILRVESYLRGRRQRIYFDAREQGGWIASSRVAGAEVAAQRRESVLSDKAHAFPGIHFRLVDECLEAYCLLDDEQLKRRPDQPPKLGDIARKLVSYLAHTADRLEFELHEGADHA